MAFVHDSARCCTEAKYRLRRSHKHFETCLDLPHLVFAHCVRPTGRLDLLESDKMEARAASLLHGLGFTKEMQAKKTRDFSGGWRMRIALARALFTPTDLLLLGAQPDPDSAHLTGLATRQRPALASHARLATLQPDASHMHTLLHSSLHCLLDDTSRVQPFARTVRHVHEPCAQMSRRTTWIWRPACGWRRR